LIGFAPLTRAALTTNTNSRGGTLVDKRPASTPQWTLDVTIYHDPAFGHRIVGRVLGRTGGWSDVGSWAWKGLGVPESLLEDIQARVEAVIVEHLVSRYGVQGELPTRWAGEADPF